MSPNVLKIRELFVAAVGKVPPERWDAFLAEACGDRTELRREVLELLQAHRIGKQETSSTNLWRNWVRWKRSRLCRANSLQGRRFLASKYQAR